MYPIKKDVLVEKIDESYLIMLMDDDDTNVYLTDLSAEIFDMCDGTHSIEDIINQIMSDYDVTYEECSKDVKECINDLVDSNIINIKEEVNGFEERVQETGSNENHY